MFWGGRTILQKIHQGMIPTGFERSSFIPDKKAQSGQYTFVTSFVKDRIDKKEFTVQYSPMHHMMLVNFLYQAFIRIIIYEV